MIWHTLLVAVLVHVGCYNKIYRLSIYIYTKKTQKFISPVLESGSKIKVPSIGQILVRTLFALRGWAYSFLCLNREVTSEISFIRTLVPLKT